MYIKELLLNFQKLKTEQFGFFKRWRWWYSSVPLL